MFSTTPLPRLGDGDRRGSAGMRFESGADEAFFVFKLIVILGVTYWILSYTPLAPLL